MTDVLAFVVLFFYPISVAITDAHWLLGPAPALRLPWFIGGYIIGLIIPFFWRRRR